MKRTDIHRPGAIVPADYHFRLAYILPGSDPHERWNTDLAVDAGRCARASGLNVFGGLGVCGVCGANYRYGAIFTHTPTGDLVHMGHDCADKYEMLADWADFNAQRESLKRARAARIQAEKNAAERAAVLDAHPGLAEALDCDHAIVKDIAARFRRYATLSPAQIALVLKLDREARERAARPPEQHTPAPQGRVVIRGVLVSRKWVDGPYGTSLKGTIKVETPAGSWLAWGTIPSALQGGTDPVLGTQGVNRGDTIELTATLQPGNEPHFAFFKRPTNARIVERARAESAA